MGGRRHSGLCRLCMDGVVEVPGQLGFKNPSLNWGKGTSIRLGESSPEREREEREELPGWNGHCPSPLREDDPVHRLHIEQPRRIKKECKEIKKKFKKKLQKRTEMAMSQA